MTDNDTNEITITTNEQALGLVLERANIEIDEVRQMGEEEFADEAQAAYDQVKADYEAARDGS